MARFVTWKYLFLLVIINFGTQFFYMYPAFFVYYIEITLINDNCLIKFLIAVTAERIKDMIYMSVDGAAACFRRHNGTHQFGCSCKCPVILNLYIFYSIYLLSLIFTKLKFLKSVLSKMFNISYFYLCSKQIW